MDLSHMTSKRPLSLWSAFITGRVRILVVSFVTLQTKGYVSFLDCWFHLNEL